MKADKAYRLSFTEKAKEIVSQMTLEEKVYLMSGNLTREDLVEEDKKKASATMKFLMKRVGTDAWACRPSSLSTGRAGRCREIEAPVFRFPWPEGRPLTKTWKKESDRRSGKK